MENFLESKVTPAMPQKEKRSSRNQNHVRVVIYLPDSIRDLTPFLKKRINKQRNVLSVLLENLLEDLSLWYDASTFESLLTDLLRKNVRLVPIKLDKDTLDKLASQKVHAQRRESLLTTTVSPEREEKDQDLNFEDVLL